MATIPVTGLSALGSALADIGQTYQTTRRQDNLLAAARARQLEDVQSQRDYSDRVRGEDRARQLEDIKAAEDREAKTYTRNREDRMTDSEANRILEESHVIAAEARRTKERAPFETNLQSLVNHAAENVQVLNPLIRRAEAVISQPAPVISPTDRAVRELAERLAGSKDAKLIDAMVPKAMEQIEGAAMMKHEISRRDAQTALISLRASVKEFTDILQSGLQKNVAPSIPFAMTPAEAPASSPGLRAVGPEALTSIVDQLSRRAQPQGSPAPASAAGGQPLFDNPGDNPVIARGNDEIRRQQQVQFQDRLTAAQQKLKDIESSLSSVEQPQRFDMLGGAGSGMGLLPPATPSPVQAAQRASNLLKAKADAEAEVRELQQLLQGPAPQTMPAPTGNSVFSVPRTGLGFRENSDWFMAGKLR